MEGGLGLRGTALVACERPQTARAGGGASLRPRTTQLAKDRLGRPVAPLPVGSHEADAPQRLEEEGAPKRGETAPPRTAAARACAACAGRNHALRAAERELAAAGERARRERDEAERERKALRADLSAARGREESMAFHCRRLAAEAEGHKARAAEAAERCDALEREVRRLRQTPRRGGVGAEASRGSPALPKSRCGSVSSADSGPPPLVARQAAAIENLRRELGVSRAATHMHEAGLRRLRQSVRSQFDNLAGAVEGIIGVQRAAAVPGGGRTEAWCARRVAELDRVAASLHGARGREWEAAAAEPASPRALEEAREQIARLAWGGSLQREDAANPPDELLAAALGTACAEGAVCEAFRRLHLLMSRSFRHFDTWKSAAAPDDGTQRAARPRTAAARPAGPARASSAATSSAPPFDMMSLPTVAAAAAAVQAREYALASGGGAAEEEEPLSSLP